MLISRELDYAVRMVRALSDNEIKGVSKICDEELVPKPWAYKILKKMEKADLVKSFCGASGGYRLTKDISEITMLDVLAIDMGALRLNECMCTEDSHDCSHHNTHEGVACAIKTEFERVENILTAALRDRTMAEVFGMLEQEVSA